MNVGNVLTCWGAVCARKAKYSNMIKSLTTCSHDNRGYTMKKGRMIKIQKNNLRNSLHDKYWKRVMLYAELSEWQKLEEYIDSYPWLATACMGPNILPDYLASEREYGLLRLLCNVDEVPVSIIAKLIRLGAKDSGGRAYLERILAGSEHGSESLEPNKTGADFPLVAALVLATNDNPVEVIDRTQRVLEQGIQDDDDNRRALAQRCIGRSQFFYDLQQLLYEHDRISVLKSCLQDEALLTRLAEGRPFSITDLKK